MINYLLTLRFDGKNYHGWQTQHNAVSVQSVLETAVEGLFGTHLAVIGCSRTDAGVHARMFCCNVRTDKQYPEKTMTAALNARLPFDIAVTDCRLVPQDFHARYSCVGKEYEYVIWNAPVRDPFSLGRAYHCPYPLDAAMLDREAKAFLGTHDFSAFRAAGSSVKTSERTVTKAEVRREGEQVLFTFAADGFLYNMVRIMTGTLLGIATGKLAPGSVPEIIASRDRSRAGATAPAEGLYLNRVEYGKEIDNE